MKKVKKTIILLLFTLSTSVFANSCETQQSGNWGDVSTWTNCGGTIPQTDDSVVIKSGHAVLLEETTAQLDSMIVEVGGDLNVGASLGRINGNGSGNDFDLSNASIDLSSSLNVVTQTSNVIFGDINGSHELHIFNQAQTRFTGTIGESTPLQSITTNSSSTVVLADADGSVGTGTIYVNDDITFKGPVLLEHNATIDGASGQIEFRSTVDSATSIDMDLTFNNVANSTITFGAAVGSTNRLKKIQIISSNNSTVHFNTSEVLSKRNQRYGSDIVINSPTNILLIDISVGGTLKLGSEGANNTIRSEVDGEETLKLVTPGVISLFSIVGDNNQTLNDFTIESTSTSLLYNDITTTGVQTYDGNLALAADVILTAGILDFRNTVDNGGQNLTLSPNSFVLNQGAFTGSGNLVKEGAGDFPVNVVSTLTGNVIINQGSIINSMSVENAFPNAASFFLGDGTSSALGHDTTDVFTLVSGQSLLGSGTCDCVLNASSGSVISPGTSPGQLSSNEMNMNSGSTLVIEINGIVAGTDYDQISVSELNLDADTSGGATLDLNFGFTPAVNDTFTLIDVTGVNPVSGTFNGLDEGNTININNKLYSVSYVGGDGNDVVLTAHGSETLFVDGDAMAGGDGQSWGTAFNTLQDALAIAVSGTEIWVAEGVYYPDEGLSEIDNDRYASFTLTGDIKLYGGFIGSETDLAQRSPADNVTILSGDIDNNDLNNDGNFIAETTSDINGGNSYHIVNAENAISDTILDGFTITAGNADGSGNSYGGGLYCNSSINSPEINLVKFIGNSALLGGGAQSFCAGNIQNSSYLNNQTIGTFGIGGAIITEGGVIKNTAFIGNTASSGGAIDNSDDRRTLTIENSELIANESTNYGGALRSFDKTIVHNTLLSGNKSNQGGAVYISSSSSRQSTFINVTLTGNEATNLGGAVTITDDTILNVENTIIYNNKDSSGTNTQSIHLVDIDNILNNSFSLIEGFGTNGTGNLDEDPMFVLATDPSSAPTDVGNARLKVGSPAINSGDNSVVSTTVDLDGFDRIQDTTVDMGAYEHSSHTVSVNVSGLALNNSVTLQNNGADDLVVNNDGIHAFSTAVSYTDGYEITVLTQPTSPNQQCLVSNPTGIIAGSDVVVDVTCTTLQYHVSVDVSGLAGGVTLGVMNNFESMDVTNNGLTQFPSLLNDGSPYDVSITSQPSQPNQLCEFTSGNESGVLNGSDVVVSIVCTTVQYNVGVDVTGLINGSFLEVENNAETLVVIDNGMTQFPTALDDGSAYQVSITTQPANPDQHCEITSGNASGTLNGADVLVDIVCQEIFALLLVDADAAPDGDGLSWATALNHLQDALALATHGTEIWVAEGVYYPDDGVNQISDHELASFMLIDGIKIYGGFAGTETLLEERDVAAHVTILSGDITQDDVNNDGNFIAESTDDIVNFNSVHVITSNQISTDTLLDGMTVTAGHAAGIIPNGQNGAGMICLPYDTSSPSINQMTFSANLAENDGGAMYGCTKDLTQSVFQYNKANDSGGAIFANDGLLDHVQFIQNSATDNGGAIDSGQGTMTIANSQFLGNYADNNGGAIYNWNNAEIVNSVFIGNLSGLAGGAILQSRHPIGDAVLEIINSTFTGNRAGTKGGAIRVSANPSFFSTVNITNNIIWNNQDETGIGTGNASINSSSFAILNYDHSLIQGYGTSGTGNLDENPLFVVDGDPSTAPNTLGNTRLRMASPAIDAGDDGAVLLSTDLDGNARIQGLAVDMGAYESSDDIIFMDGFE